VYRQAVMASVKQRLQAPDVDKQSVLTTARAPPPPPKKKTSFLFFPLWFLKISIPYLKKKIKK